MDRFWAKVTKGAPNECWPWTAYLNKKGYGVFGFRGRVWGAHRVAWVLANGEIPDGLHVLHRCDNRRCCNSAHLFLGTNQDNVDDREMKGRNKLPRAVRAEERARGERHGMAKLSAEDAKYILAKRGVVAQRRLAAMYGVTQALISSIHRRKIWKELPDQRGTL